MRTALELVNDIQIATPCTADWHAMAGDDRARHCGQCDKKVFNIENLTVGGAAAVRGEPGGRPGLRGVG